MPTASVNSATPTSEYSDVASFRDLPRDERWGYIQEDRLFLDAVEAGGPAPVAAVTAFDGLNSVLAVEAVYESIRTGKSVRLS